jgi:membrane protease YdiL (CAAX protease family)
MKHLESAFKGKNSFWRYIVMFGSVLIMSNTIGGIPIFITYANKAATNPEIIAKLRANPSDLSVLGFDPNIGLLIMLFPFLVGLLTFVLLIKPLNNRTLRQTINGTSAIRWNRFFVSALVWMVLSAAYLFIYKGIDPSNFTINNKSFTLLILFGIAVLFLPFQAAFEEILFRGYLMQGFAVLAMNRWSPLIMTSILFGIMHAFNPEIKEFGFFTMMPQYILFGLLFVITTILDDGIEIALGAHTANNVFMSIMVTNSSSVLQTPALFEQSHIDPWIDFGGLIISALLFFMVMRMIYKWDDMRLIWRKVRKEEEGVQTL